MKFYFDYFYYRISELFIKTKRDRGTRAVVIISIAQSVLVLTLTLLLQPLVLKRSDIHHMLTRFPWFIALVVFLFSFYNFLKYRGRYHEFAAHWCNEPKQKRKLKGVVIVISLIVPLLVYCFVTNWLHHI